MGDHQVQHPMQQPAVPTRRPMPQGQPIRVWEPPAPSDNGNSAYNSHGGGEWGGGNRGRGRGGYGGYGSGSHPYQETDAIVLGGNGTEDDGSGMHQSQREQGQFTDPSHVSLSDADQFGNGGMNQNGHHLVRQART